jgi:conjugal transfer pilus assembly protein TraK
MGRMSQARFALATLLALASGAHAQEDAGIALPALMCQSLTGAETPQASPAPTSTWLGAVPTSAIRTVGADTIEAGFVRQQSSPFLPGWQVRPVALSLGPRTVSVPSGTSALVEIAINHLNRIVTPFAKPVVHTVSDASTKIDGNVIYVATSSEAPAVLYISDGQEPETAISLTLAPRHVPPRETRVTVPGYRARKARAPQATAPSAWEGQFSVQSAFAAHPYVQSLTEMLRSLTQQKNPPGFKARKPTGPERVRCSKEVAVTSRQVKVGPLGRVLVIGVSNRTKATVSIDEHTCAMAAAGGTAIAAVAAWPHAKLPRGQSTQLFLVLQDAEAGP